MTEFARRQEKVVQAASGIAWPRDPIKKLKWRFFFTTQKEYQETKAGLLLSRTDSSCDSPRGKQKVAQAPWPKVPAKGTERGLVSRRDLRGRRGASSDQRVRPERVHTF